MCNKDIYSSKLSNIYYDRHIDITMSNNGPYWTPVFGSKFNTDATGPSNNISGTPTEVVMFEYTGKGCVAPKNVTSVRFHPSVIEVEDEAFRGFKHLEEVVFHEGLQKIGRNAFHSCKSLSSITVPSSVTEISHGTFNCCISLKKVTLNEGIQKIGEWSFQNCSSLLSITIPSTLTEIRDGAFAYCAKLKEVVLNEGLQQVGQYVFYGCTSCERLVFSSLATRLDVLIQTGSWKDIENKVHEVRGVVERSDGELFVSRQTMGGVRKWNRARKDLDKIVRLISYYEIKEGTSIFELALWKFKLDQVDEANPTTRKKCRMDVPGPVKDIILQYLSNECLLSVSDA